MCWVIMVGMHSDRVTAFLAVAVLIIGRFGYSLARYHRDLADLRKAIASVPVLRRSMFGHLRTLLILGAVMLVVAYATVARH